MTREWKLLVCDVLLFVTAILAFIGLGITWRSFCVALGGYITDADREIFQMGPRFLWAAAATLIVSVVMLLWSER